MKSIVPAAAGLLLLALAAAPVQAGEAAPRASIPDPYFQFDPVLEGDEVVHDFVVRNGGEAELEIKNIKTG